MWALSGQRGRLTATEVPSDVSVGRSKTGVGAILTRAVLGGGAFLRPPPQVFRKYLKNGGAQRRRFWYTCSYIISAHVVKISDLGRSRSGHQVTSSDLTSEKVQRLAIATPTERSL